MIKGDGWPSQAAEQRRWSIRQGESAIRKERTRRVLPGVCRRDQRHIAEITAARPEPARLELRTDGAKLFAEPGVQRGRGDGIHVAPPGSSVLEGNRHVESTDAHAP